MTNGHAAHMTAELGHISRTHVHEIEVASSSMWRATVALTTCDDSAALRALLPDVLQELRNACTRSVSGFRQR